MTVARIAAPRQSLPRQRAKKPQVVPLQKRAIETRRQILLAAAALFRDKGYKATTLRDIARAVGMGAGSFYYYFRSKEEVLHEVLDRGIETVDNMVRSAVNVLPPSATPLTQLRQAILGHLRALLDKSGYSTAYARIYNELPRKLNRPDHPRRIAYIAHWRDLVVAAQKSGEIRSDIHVPTFVAFMLGTMSRAADWYDPDTADIEQVAEWIADWTFNGVRRRAG